MIVVASQMHGNQRADSGPGVIIALTPGPACAEFPLPQGHGRSYPADPHGSPHPQSEGNEEL
jgi:hypothetical protein